jgi:C-terminus of AA_permease
LIRITETWLILLTMLQLLHRCQKIIVDGANETELMVFLCSLGTWIRVSVWLLAGALIYIFYGYAHSKAAKVEKAYMQIGSPTHGDTI